MVEQRCKEKCVVLKVMIGTKDVANLLITNMKILFFS